MIDYDDNYVGNKKSTFISTYGVNVISRFLHQYIIMQKFMRMCACV